MEEPLPRLVPPRSPREVLRWPHRLIARTIGRPRRHPEPRPSTRIAHLSNGFRDIEPPRRRIALNEPIDVRERTADRRLAPRSRHSPEVALRQAGEVCAATQPEPARRAIDPVEQLAVHGHQYLRHRLAGYPDI